MNFSTGFLFSKYLFIALFTCLFLILLSPFLGLGSNTEFILYKYYGLERRIAAEIVASSLCIFFLLRNFFSHNFSDTLKNEELFGKLRAYSILFIGLYCLTIIILFLSHSSHFEVHTDIHWHQGSIDKIFDWSSFNTGFEGNLLYNFGIQLPLNPFFSPFQLVGSLFDADIRIPVNIILQNLTLFGVIYALFRHLEIPENISIMSGMMIALLCTYPIIPPFTNQLVLGLEWGEGAIVVALVFLLYCKIGRNDSHGKDFLFSVFLFILTIWSAIAHGEIFAFICISSILLISSNLLALLISRSYKELLTKLISGLFILAFLIVIGLDKYIYFLYKYTFSEFMPVRNYLTYKTIALPFYTPFSENPLFVFMYSLTILSSAYMYFKTGFELRKIALTILIYQILLYCIGALNAAFNIVNISFWYLEIMLLPFFLIPSVIVLSNNFVIFVSLVKYIVDRFTPSRTAGKHLFDLHSIGLLLFTSFFLLYVVPKPSNLKTYPPQDTSTPAMVLRNALSLQSEEPYRGKVLTIVDTKINPGLVWPSIGNTLSSYYAYSTGIDFFVNLATSDVPLANEYGHWTSPPRALFNLLAFGKKGDVVHKAVVPLRNINKPLARLNGVTHIVSTEYFDGMELLYQEQIKEKKLNIMRIDDSNLGHFNPINVIVKDKALAIAEELLNPEFDGSKTAIVEKNFERNLVKVSEVSLIPTRDSELHVKATSKGWSLLVLPFDYSHCLDTSQNDIQLIPVNLALLGLLFEGDINTKISYNYSLLKGYECRSDDVQRMVRINFKKAATKFTATELMSNGT